MKKNNNFINYDKLVLIKGKNKNKSSKPSHQKNRKTACNKLTQDFDWKSRITNEQIFQWFHEIFEFITPLNCNTSFLAFSYRIPPFFVESYPVTQVYC